MINHETAQFRAKVRWISVSGNAIPPTLLDAALMAKYQVTDAIDLVADIIVVDLYGVESDNRAAADAVATARRSGSPAGVLIAADGSISDDQRKLLTRLGEVVYLKNSVEPLICAIRERLRLCALADETGDRIKTLVADGRVATLPSSASTQTEFRVLVAGKPSATALAVANHLSASGKKSIGVFSAGQAMRALDHEKFNGAIFIPDDENDLLVALARALRRHREHRRLHVILISPDEGLFDRRAAKEGLDIMASGRVSEDLCPRLERLSRRAAMASAMRAFLRSPEGNGAASGAASPRLFAQHAARVLNSADRTGRTVSFIALSLSKEDDDSTHASARLALEEALRTSVRLVRAEDMITRLTTTTLILMLRGARGEDAEKVARRLEGVIAGTQPRSIHHRAEVHAAAHERPRGVEIERMIAALVADLRQRNIASARSSA